jgi:hypothetical protein
MCSFIFVWSNFWVIKSGSQSIIALIFGTSVAPPNDPFLAY